VDPLEEIVDLVELAALEELIGHFAVVGHADAAALGQLGQ